MSRDLIPFFFVISEGFKKTETDVTPSSEKEAVPNPADQYINEPVHGENVLNMGHDEKNGNKHDQENKVGNPALQMR